MNSEYQVNIFGPKILQNELLAKFITQETGYVCQRCEETDIIRIINKQKDKSVLILWDCLNKGISNLWTELNTHFSDNGLKCHVALFNISSKIDVKLEKGLLKQGIRGVFVQNCPSSIFIKGIQSLKKGGLWFSSQAINQALLDMKKDYEHFIDLKNPLTLREKEILLCVTSGASNDRISYNLNISPHTVKAHIYNIYKKIDVSNRFQASLWAAKNF